MRTQLYILSFLILCLISGKTYAKRIKDHHLKKDTITNVYTAPGYTTLIELPTKPTRVVVGDQNSFKIEFVGKNLAVKPLAENIRTNLFIFTKDKQFQCTLISGPVSKLQYLVRLNNKTAQIKNITLTRKRKQVHLRLHQYKRFNGSRRREIKFEIQNRRKEAITVNPKHFNIRANKKLLPISSIYIDKFDIPPGESVSAKIVFIKGNSKHKESIQFIISLNDNELLTYPFVGRYFQ